MDWPDAAAERLISTRFQVWTEHAPPWTPRASSTGRWTVHVPGRRAAPDRAATGPGYRVAEVVARLGGTAAAPTA